MKHLLQKILGAVILLAGLVCVFGVVAQPPDTYSMAADMYDIDLILFWFPLTALAYGVLLPFLSFGDLRWAIAEFAAFAIAAPISCHVYDVTYPWLTLIYDIIVLVPALVIWRIQYPRQPKPMPDKPRFRLKLAAFILMNLNFCLLFFILPSFPDSGGLGGYYMQLLLIGYPLGAVFTGLLGALISFGDRFYMASALGIFAVCSLISGGVYTVYEPPFALVYTAIALAVCLITRFLLYAVRLLSKREWRHKHDA
ncbi:MAG: hypothetical protein IJ493_07240 [Clostridia bacterium]|nr:hypothetical protein [Clostridia bacterium]